MYNKIITEREKDLPVEYSDWQRKLRRQPFFETIKTYKTLNGFNKMVISLKKDDVYTDLNKKTNRMVFLYKALSDFPTDTHKLISIHAQFTHDLITITSELRQKSDLQIELEHEANDQCQHFDTSISSDGYEVCNDCGAYLKELL